MRIGFKYGAPEKNIVGINRTILETISETLVIDKEDEFVSLEDNYLKLDINNLIPYYCNKVVLRNAIDYSSMFDTDIDLIHSYFNPIHGVDRKCPKIITIYDIIAFIHPEWHPGAAPFFKTELIKSAKCADAIIAISEHTKNDLINYYGINEDKIKVIYLGIDSSLKYDMQKDITSEKYHIDEYILSVCTLEPRKNLRGFIEGFISYKQQHPLSKLKLVLTGKAGWDYEFSKYIDSLGEYKRDIVLTGYVSNDELASLYKYASAVGYVSFYEGFGLPILEAMAAGKAVICSNTTSMPEVGGDAVEYCDPYDYDSIANAITNIVENDSHKRELEEKALERSKLFSYNKTAQETIELYHSFK